MYIRKDTRRHKDRVYTNYRLVEACHTPDGPRQRTICSLGDLAPRPHHEWLALAHWLQAALEGKRFLFEPEGEDAELIERVRRRGRRGKRGRCMSGWRFGSGWAATMCCGKRDFARAAGS